MATLKQRSLGLMLLGAVACSAPSEEVNAGGASGMQAVIVETNAVAETFSWLSSWWILRPRSASVNQGEQGDGTGGTWTPTPPTGGAAASQARNNAKTALTEKPECRRLLDGNQFQALAVLDAIPVKLSPSTGANAIATCTGVGTTGTSMELFAGFYVCDEWCRDVYRGDLAKAQAAAFLHELGHCSGAAEAAMHSVGGSYKPGTLTINGTTFSAGWDSNRRDQAYMFNVMAYDIDVAKKCFDVKLPGLRGGR